MATLNEGKIDDGHVNLMQDIADLGYLAQNYEFHDFKNTNYPAPKMVLREILLKMAQHVVDGRYDNK